MAGEDQAQDKDAKLGSCASLSDQQELEIKLQSVSPGPLSPERYQMPAV